MQRLFPLFSLMALFFAACSEKPATDTERKPNFVIIQADDLGWSDLGIHGNQLAETPSLDQMAQASVQFSHFYVNPCCAPTRAGLLTGRHFLKTGVSHVHGGKDFLNLNERTFADILQANGYATGMWGKWHSGHSKGYFPWERGFGEAYKAQLYKHENSKGEMNGKPVEYNQWADEVIFDQAMDFMERNREKPFLAYISSLTPHAPLRAPEPLIAKYEAKGLSPALSTLYAMVEQLDGQVGRLLQYLDSAGLADNTVVFFLSDNGPAVNNRDLSPEDHRLRYVNGLKGHKGNIWENGVKSPLFVYAKGRFKPHRVGGLADVTDILPTLLDMAGIQPPTDGLPLDGQSLLPSLEGESTNPRQKVSFNYANRAWQPTDLPWSPEGTLDEYRPVTESMKDTMQPRHQVISMYQGNYKLMLNAKQYANTPPSIEQKVLVNLEEDPLENQNILEQNPALAQQMEGQLMEWFANILQMPGSFSMPLFKIGYPGDTVYTVLAKGSQAISEGITPTSNALRGWAQMGDWAKYQLEVEQAGDYEMILNYHAEEATGAVLQVSLDGEPAGEVAATSLQNSSPTSIALPQGKHLLTVTLNDLNGAKQAFQELVSIHLKPIN